MRNGWTQRWSRVERRLKATPVLRTCTRSQKPRTSTRGSNRGRLRTAQTLLAWSAAPSRSAETIGTENFRRRVTGKASLPHRGRASLAQLRGPGERSHLGRVVPAPFAFFPRRFFHLDLQPREGGALVHPGAGHLARGDSRDDQRVADLPR